MWFLLRYLLKYVTDHAPEEYKEILQRKLIRGIQKAPHSRTLPPSLLEWRSTRQRSNMALPLTFPDGAVSTVNVDSWTTCEEVIEKLGIFLIYIKMLVLSGGFFGHKYPRHQP